MSLRLPDEAKDCLPLRIVAKQDPATGGWLALTEHSFSMGWSADRVLVFWSGQAYSNFGTTSVIDAEEGAMHNIRGETELHFDPLDPKCPLEVDLAGWWATFTAPHGTPENGLPYVKKYDRRNAHYTVRDFAKDTPA